MPRQGGDQEEATRRHLLLCRTGAVVLGLVRRQSRRLVASSWSQRCTPAAQRCTLGVDERRTPGSPLPLVPASGSPLPLVRAPGSPVLMEDNLPVSVVRPASPVDDDVRPAFVVCVQRRRWSAGVVRLQRRRRSPHHGDVPGVCGPRASPGGDEGHGAVFEPGDDDFGRGGEAGEGAAGGEEEDLGGGGGRGEGEEEGGEGEDGVEEGGGCCQGVF